MSLFLKVNNQKSINTNPTAPSSPKRLRTPASIENIQSVKQFAGAHIDESLNSGIERVRVSDIPIPTRVILKNKTNLPSSSSNARSVSFTKISKPMPSVKVNQLSLQMSNE